MSVKLFKVGKIWHYRYQVAPFPRVQRSTKESSATKAEIVARKAYDDAVAMANGGRPIPTLADVTSEWLDVYRPTMSRDHIKSVDTFKRLHMYDLGDLSLDQLTTAKIELARNEHLRTHKPSSGNHWLRIIKLLVNWAVKRKILPRLPWQVRMLKVQKRPRAILPVDVAAAWFTAVDQASRAAGIGVAVRLMLFLGLRESEATSARWEWIDWERKTYTPGVTKGREAEPLPMPGWLVEYLTPHRRTDGLIATKRNGDRFPPGFARRAMRSANVECKTLGITPHRLRGTIATLLSEAGVPIQTIQKFLRHKSPLTTMAYLEKNMGIAVRAQHEISQKIGFEWRESGERLQSNPTAT